MRLIRNAPLVLTLLAAGCAGDSIDLDELAEPIASEEAAIIGDTGPVRNMPPGSPCVVGSGDSARIILPCPPPDPAMRIDPKPSPCFTDGMLPLPCPPPPPDDIQTGSDPDGNPEPSPCFTDGLLPCPPPEDAVAPLGHMKPPPCFTDGVLPCPPPDDETTVRGNSERSPCFTDGALPLPCPPPPPDDIQAGSDPDGNLKPPPCFTDGALPCPPPED